MMKRITPILTIATLFAVIVIMLSGCITISAPSTSTSASQGSAPTSIGSPSAPKPLITFTAAPTIVNPGQPVTLTWDVANATDVSIQPNIGSVNAKGSKVIMPTATMTYMLVAKGTGGEATSSVAVTVTNLVGGKPDLTITEIWIDLQTVYYTVVNLGGDMPKGTRAYLWVEGLQRANDYVEKLSAGETHTYSFGSYSWPYRFDSAPGQGPVSFTLKVCVDIDNDIAELDEGNNCFSRTYGSLFLYEFTRQAHMADWGNSNTDELTWPMIPGDPKGAAFVPPQSVEMEDGQLYFPALCIYTPSAAGSWIQGKFGEFYMDPGGTRSRPIQIPKNAKFTTRVGFRNGAPVAQGASITLSTINEAGSITPFQTLSFNKDGKLKTYEVDLSGWEGKKVQFTIRVEGRDSGGVDWVVLIDPKIVQGQ